MAKPKSSASHHYGLDADRRRELYLAFSQNVFPRMSLVVRTTKPSERMVSDIRSAVWAVDLD